MGGIEAAISERPVQGNSIHGPHDSRAWGYEALLGGVESFLESHGP